MGGIALSIVAAAAIVGGYLSIKAHQENIIDNYKQAKTIVSYANKAEAKNTISNADLDIQAKNLIVGSLQDKDKIDRLQKAMEVALKTNQNPNCLDLAKTHLITLNECEFEMHKKNAFANLSTTGIAFNDKNASSKNINKAKQVAKIVKVQMLPNANQINSSVNSVSTQVQNTIQNVAATNKNSVIKTDVPFGYKIANRHRNKMYKKTIKMEKHIATHVVQYIPKTPINIKIPESVTNNPNIKNVASNAKIGKYQAIVYNNNLTNKHKKRLEDVRFRNSMNRNLFKQIAIHNRVLIEKARQNREKRLKELREKQKQASRNIFSFFPF